ncbi:MAG TPA: class I SAM-dependent methyltransferase [Pyrinomonadaceae bacterium]|jgi:ubiquinone/menaquinone biosynthesis C-methylase UbiE
MPETASNLSRARAIYDRAASYYDGLMRPLERLGLSTLRARTLAELPEDSSILEIGTGTGLNFSYYPRGAHGAASELSREMLKIASGKDCPAGLHLVQSSAEELPFPDASFDAAFATLVFCSLVSPERAFKELRRVVRPGGTIALLEHVRPTGLLGPIFDLLSILTVAIFEDHFNRRTVEAATRAGLLPLRVEPHLLGIINVIVCVNSQESKVWNV